MTTQRPTRAVRWSGWLPVPVYIFVVFGLSAWTVPRTPLGVSDKIAHFLEFGGLALLVMRAVIMQFPLALPWRAAALGTVFAIACGATDEWIQSYAPLRTSDLADLAADAVGAAVVSTAAAVAISIVRSRATQSDG